MTGYEANKRLVDLANERSERAGMGRRAQVEIWDTLKPKFPRRYFHHGMAIEMLHGAKPDKVLTAVALALKPGAQFVLLETVADAPLDPADPVVATWARLDHRSADVPSEPEITNVLVRLKFDVRIVEDVSRRHMQSAMQGWRIAVEAMAGAPPALRQIGMVVHEAELWTARFRLMRAGKLRLARWHAIAGGGMRPPRGLTGGPVAPIQRRSSRGAEMRIRNSLKSAKARDKNCRVVRRHGRVYVINKKNPRMKARQG